MILLIVIGGAWFISTHYSPSQPGSAPVPSSDLSDLIQVTAPTPNAIITSPLGITGKARGNWYFEASFPAVLLDANGTEIARAPAQAIGDWMTNDFVPFALSLPFTTPKTDTGVLVLKKDNPSGLPQNDKEIRIPVRFR